MCEGLAATLVCLGATRRAISTYQHTLDLLEGSEVCFVYRLRSALDGGHSFDSVFDLC